MIRRTMSANQDLTRPERTQNKDATLELKKLIADGEASGIGTKTMDEIKAEARKELDL